MNRYIRNIYFLFTVLVIIVLAGFYVLFQKINGLSGNYGQDQSSVSVQQIATSSGTQSQSTSTPGLSTTTATTSPETGSAGSPVSIDSSILFNATSSSSLQPQANLTILVSKVSESPDGNVAVTVKVFTDSASSYSAVDIGSLVQIFNPSGQNQSANNIVGAFKAMPPQSSVDGVLNFTVSPGTSSVTLQIGQSDNLNFYKFDFTSGSYKQITVG